jgi:hypothetical protein
MAKIWNNLGGGMGKTYIGAIEKKGNSKSFLFPGIDVPDGTTPAVLSLDIPDSGDYKQLELVLSEAYDQASEGKGKERHACHGQRFEDQLICELSRILLGHPFAFNAGQAIKKIVEAGRLPKDAAKREYLGAINYIAGMIILNGERT